MTSGVVRGGQSFAALALLALVLACCRSSGCKQLDDLVGVQPESEEAAEAQAQRGLYDCTCDYLTDTDLSGQERVRVCAADPTVAVKRGSGCAQLHSPGMINRCTCVLFGTVDCAENDCRQNR